MSFRPGCDRYDSRLFDSIRPLVQIIKQELSHKMFLDIFPIRKMDDASPSSTMV